MRVLVSSIKNSAHQLGILRMRKFAGQGGANFVQEPGVLPRLALQALGKRHKRERAELAAYARRTRAIQADSVRARYQPEIDVIKLSRRQQVAALKERHRDDMLREDSALQVREAERELGRETLKHQIDSWKKPQRVPTLQAGPQPPAIPS